MKFKNRISKETIIGFSTISILSITLRLMYEQDFNFYIFILITAITYIVLNYILYKKSIFKITLSSNVYKKGDILKTGHDSKCKVLKIKKEGSNYILTVIKI